MNCQIISQKMHDYMDGLLQPIDRKQVESHLASCPSCQTQLNLIKKTWEMLRHYPAIEPSDAYVSNFYTRLTQQPAKAKEWSLEWLLPPQFSKVALASAVGLCLIFVSYFSWVSINSKTWTLVQTMAAFDQDELDVIENFDLVENYDVLYDLDLLENLDMVEELEQEAS